MATESKMGLAILLAVFGLLLGGILSYAFLAPVKEVAGPTVYVDKPVVTPVNLTSVENKLDVIAKAVTEDEDFEDKCVKLADEEWSAKDNKAVFEELSNIDDRDDISSIKVEDVEVSNVDADDGDCKVVEELIVRYEDSDGDNAKVHVEVKTIIKDGEVENQIIKLI